jgi:hypothetical protein
MQRADSNTNDESIIIDTELFIYAVELFILEFRPLLTSWTQQYLT